MSVVWGQVLELNIRKDPQQAPFCSLWDSPFRRELVVFCKLNYMPLGRIAFLCFSDSSTFSTGFWNPVLCLKHVKVQWVGFDHVRLVIATSQWGVDLEPPSETWQGSRQCVVSVEMFAGQAQRGLGLLTEKTTRDVDGKMLDSPRVPHIAGVCAHL